MRQFPFLIPLCFGISFLFGEGWPYALGALVTTGLFARWYGPFVVNRNYPQSKS